MKSHRITLGLGVRLFQLGWSIGKGAFNREYIISPKGSIWTLVKIGRAFWAEPFTVHDRY